MAFRFYMLGLATLFLLLVQGSYLPNYIQQKKSCGFAQTIGKIDRCGIKHILTTGASGSYDLITNKYISVAYEYEVGGSNRIGTRFRYLMSVSLLEQSSFLSKHPVRSDVTVYFDPSDASNSVLSPGLNTADRVALVCLMTANLCVIGFWVVLFRRRKRIRMGLPCSKEVKIELL